MTDSIGPAVLLGLIRLREHCTFTWEEPQRGGLRTARVRVDHCMECIAELRKLGYVLDRDPLAQSRPGGR